MSGSWWVRLSTVFFTLVLSVWLLAPTFLGGPDMAAVADGLQSTDAVEEVEQTWWEGLMPSTRLNLGLDLQGGIDLTLDVDMDEAVLSSVARDVQPLMATSDEEGIIVSDIRRERGKPVLLVTLPAETELSAFRSAVMSKYQDYAYEGVDGGVHRFALTDTARTEIETGAIEQAVEMLRNRVDETGVKEPQIVRKGNRRINVQLPGVSDAKQAVDVLGTTALLEFFMVDEEFQPAALDSAIEAARTAMPEKDFLDDQALNYWLQDNQKIGPKNVVMWQYADEISQLGGAGLDRGDRFAAPYILHLSLIHI